MGVGADCSDFLRRVPVVLGRRFGWAVVLHNVRTRGLRAQQTSMSRAFVS